MPQPTPYAPEFVFGDFQASNPTAPLPGYRVDAELDHLAGTLFGVLGNLELIQRDDGKLRDGVVTPDSLNQATLDEIVAAVGPVAGASPIAQIIGTYAAIAAAPPAIPVPVIAVATSGYADPGDGGNALFVYSAAPPASGPKFQDTLGRWFGLAEKSPSSRMFGVGLGAATAAQNSVRLQQFFDYLATARFEMPRLEGEFSIDAAVALTLSENVTNGTGNLMWTAKVTATTAMDVMLTINTTSGVWNHIHGEVHLNGGNQTAYAARQVQTAVEFTGTGRLIVDSWDLRYFKHTGLYAEQGVNNNLASLGKVSGTYIGSGAPGADATQRLTASWSIRVDAGSDGNTNQLTTLTVDVLPDSYAETHPMPILVLLNGLTHKVSVIDRVNSKITVESWPDPAVTSGTLTYLIGSTVSLEGSDANVISIDTLDVSNVANALSSSGFYGAYVGRLVATAVGSAIIVGSTTSETHDGLTVGTLYLESGSTKSIIRVTRQDVKVNILNVQAAGGDPSLIDIPAAPWDVTRAGRLSTYNTLDSFVLRGPYGFHQYWKRSVGPFGSSQPLWLDRPSRRHEVYHLDSQTLTLQTPDDNLRRYFGYNANTITFAGTAANGAPSGSFTFTPPAGHKINGGAANANAVFGGHKGPVTFVAKYDGVIDWVVYPLGGTVRGVNVVDPAALTSANPNAATAAATVATATAPAGGATIDTQSRTAIGQLIADDVALRGELAQLVADNASLRTQLTALRADVTAIRTQLIAMNTSLKNGGVLS